MGPCGRNYHKIPAAVQKQTSPKGFSNPRAARKQKKKQKASNNFNDRREAKPLLRTDNDSAQRHSKSICPSSFCPNARPLSGTDFEREWAQTIEEVDLTLSADTDLSFDVEEIKKSLNASVITLLADGIQKGKFKCFFYAETADGVLALGSISLSSSLQLVAKSSDKKVAVELVELIKSKVGGT